MAIPTVFTAPSIASQPESLDSTITAASTHPLFDQLAILIQRMHQDLATKMSAVESSIVRLAHRVSVLEAQVKDAKSADDSKESQAAASRQSSNFSPFGY
jgi:hypothetical protein